jgi:hypothetical protein
MTQTEQRNLSGEEIGVGSGAVRGTVTGPIIGESEK